MNNTRVGPGSAERHRMPHRVRDTSKRVGGSSSFLVPLWEKVAPRLAYSRAPDAAQHAAQPRGALLIRGLSMNKRRVGPGSAERHKNAAPRPGHERKRGGS